MMVLVPMLSLLLAWILVMVGKARDYEPDEERNDNDEDDI